MGHELGAGHELIHWAAALVLVVGGIVALLLAARARFTPVAVATDGRAGRDRPEPRGAGLPSVDASVIRIAVVLSLGAAAIHLAAAPHHYGELGDLGAGFVAAGAFQAAWARAAWRLPSRRTLLVGMAGNLAIVGAWIVSRSVGLPDAAGSWRPEAIGLPDAAATVFELLIAGLLAVRLVGQGLVRSEWARSVAAVAVVPTLGLVLLTTTLATLAVAAGADHGMLPGVGSAVHAAVGP